MSYVSPRLSRTPHLMSHIQLKVLNTAIPKPRPQNDAHHRALCHQKAQHTQTHTSAKPPHLKADVVRYPQAVTFPHFGHTCQLKLSDTAIPHPTPQHQTTTQHAPQGSMPPKSSAHTNTHKRQPPHLKADVVREPQAVTHGSEQPAVDHLCQQLQAHGRIQRVRAARCR
jgi:hypothetical protein